MTLMRPVHRNMFPIMLQALGLTQPVVEVGVAEGKYSKSFLQFWPFDYFMVDRWCHIHGYDDVMNGDDAEHEKRFQQARQVAVEYGSRVQILRTDSVEAAGSFADRSLSLVYIDADHSYEACKRDILAWAPKIVRGGILAGHDYYTNPPFDVRRAVADVCVGPCGVTHEPCPSWWVHIA